MKSLKKINKRGPKHGNLMGIRIDSTSRSKVLDSISERIDLKDKFYIVTPNPEIVLMAMRDWLLKKAILRSTFSIADGVGLAQGYKYLNLPDPDGPFRFLRLLKEGFQVALATFNNRKWLTADLEVIKGRELFLDILEMAETKNLKVFLFGGENSEAQKAVEILKVKYKNIQFKTNFYFPKYDKNAQPSTKADRLMHKKIIGDIKMFEPDLIFVGLGAPRQEKWIFRNFFRLKATGAMVVGGTFNYIAGMSKLPPKWMVDNGLEWVWRLIQEPHRFKRISNAFPKFPLKVFKTKLTRKSYDPVFSSVEK